MNTQSIAINPLTLKEIARAAEGRLNNKVFENHAVTGILTDSREEAAGRLFVPFKGARFDGHAFIPDVFARGAAACLSETELPACENPLIYVKDTKRALMRIAAYYRGLFDVNVVGVTGSTGKTTAKDMIAAVLSQKYEVLKTEGNYNNEIGLPLTLFRLTEKTQYAVVEMGMSHFGEIRALSKIARPGTAVITNIGVSHIENLGSREGILKAKTEIFEALPENGAAIVYAGDDLLKTLTRKPILFYGTAAGNDFFATSIEHHGVRGVSFTLNQKKGGAIDIRVPVPGFHMVLNALAAAAVGVNAGLTLEEIKAGIERFRPSAMRMDIFRAKSGVTVINDAYNASPASVKAALDVLSSAKGEGETVCVLGDMLELGDFAGALHFETGRYAAQLNIDAIWTFGEKSVQTHEGALSMIQSFNSTSSAVHFENKEELIGRLLAETGPHTTVLIKASRGMRFEEIVQRMNEGVAVK